MDPVTFLLAVLVVEVVSGGAVSSVLAGSVSGATREVHADWSKRHVKAAKARRKRWSKTRRGRLVLRVQDGSTAMARGGVRGLRSGVSTGLSRSRSAWPRPWWAGRPRTSRQASGAVDGSKPASVDPVDGPPVDYGLRTGRDPTRHPVTGVHCQWQETTPGLAGRIARITDRTGVMALRRVCAEPVVPGGYFCAEHQAVYDRDQEAGLHPGPGDRRHVPGYWRPDPPPTMADTPTTPRRGGDMAEAINGPQVITRWDELADEVSAFAEACDAAGFDVPGGADTADAVRAHAARVHDELDQHVEAAQGTRVAAAAPFRD